MNLSEICIKRPVLATVLSLILIVIGVMGLNYLETRFLPKFESSNLMINTTYAGASAKLVETSVTTVLEDAVSGIEGIDTVSSTSSQGYSQIILSLKDNADLQTVENKVRQSLQNAQSKLPSNVNTPQVYERGGGSSDLLDIGFIDPNMSLGAINDYLKRNVVDNISQVEGVAQVEQIGSNDYTLQVRLDPNKMRTFGLTINEVQQAVQNANLELPAGSIKGYDFDYPVTAKTKINTAAEFDNLVIKQVGNNQVKLSDVGRAVLAPSTLTQGFVRIDGKAGVMLSIAGTDNGNPITTVNGVMHYLDSMKSQLPSGMKMNVVYDQSTFMKNSIHEVYESITFAIICVLIVIFLFLGELRSVAVPVVTIPICIFATFGLMYFFGFTINIITLLAIVLSIGLVVDDAIVVLENIYRYIEQGMKPLAAAMKGAKEITFPVIAMTLTLAAVYAPVGLVHGKISAIFKPFALTLAGAVIISGFVALTLTPMMCSRVLKPHIENKRSFSNILDKFFTRLANIYQDFISGVLKKRIWVVLIVVAAVIGGGAYTKGVGFTFMPQEDIGLVMSALNIPSGANINYISKQAEKLSNILSEDNSVESVLAFATTDQQGFSAVLATLKSLDNRNESAQQVANTANAKVAKTPGLDASVFPPSFGGSMKHQLEFTITGDKTYDELYQISKDLVNKLNKYPGMKNVTSTVKFDSQGYDIHVNRVLAAKLNVSVIAIDNEIAAMLGGIKISTIDVENESYDVYLQGLAKYQNKIDDLKRLYVGSNDGKMIPLTNLISIQPTLSQLSLDHFNKQRAATINAQLGAGYDLGTVVQYLKQNLPQILPSDVHYAFQGQAKESSDSQNSMLLIFVLALVFIYLVLSAQFESFFDPLIILIAVPFSVVSALVGLKMTGGSINIYTIVGLVTLIGLIAKHGILITQFANNLKEEGMPMREAVAKAASIRLRPILMTTAAMIFGVLPLLLASGASAESRIQIGTVLAVGLFFGTFFSLVVVPVIYTYINQFKRFVTRA